MSEEHTKLTIKELYLELSKVSTETDNLYRRIIHLTYALNSIKHLTGLHELHLACEYSENTQQAGYILVGKIDEIISRLPEEKTPCQEQ